MLASIARAFGIGGMLAVAAQLLVEMWTALGADAADAVSFMMMTLGVLGAIVAGSGPYRALERLGGMGAAMPISGLASLVADRVEAAVRGASTPGTPAGPARAGGSGNPPQGGLPGAVLRGAGSVIVNFAPGCVVALVLAFVA